MLALDWKYFIRFLRHCRRRRRRCHHCRWLSFRGAMAQYYCTTISFVCYFLSTSQYFCIDCCRMQCFFFFCQSTNSKRKKKKQMKIIIKESLEISQRLDVLLPMQAIRYTFFFQWPGCCLVAGWCNARNILNFIFLHCLLTFSLIYCDHTAIHSLHITHSAMGCRWHSMVCLGAWFFFALLSFFHSG